MVQDVRRDEGLEPWPLRLLDLVEFSSEEVIDFFRRGSVGGVLLWVLDRFSEAGRIGFVFDVAVGFSEEVCLGWRCRVGAVLLLCIFWRSILEDVDVAAAQHEGPNPLSTRAMIDPYKRKE